MMSKREARLPLGRVYAWKVDPTKPAGGYISEDTVGLPNLEISQGNRGHLTGQYVSVRNDAFLKERDSSNKSRIVAVGDAVSDSNGDFLFQPNRGGETVDDLIVHREDPKRISFVEASHFGEVNAYYHVDRIASYIDSLLHELGIASLPRITVVVNAHQPIQNPSQKSHFTGGHYRLPSWTYDIPEPKPVSPSGEIHLGLSSRL